jgi:hypothetical protein
LLWTSHHAAKQLCDGRQPTLPGAVINSYLSMSTIPPRLSKEQCISGNRVVRVSSKFASVGLERQSQFHSKFASFMLISCYHASKMTILLDFSAHPSGRVLRSPCHQDVWSVTRQGDTGNPGSIGKTERGTGFSSPFTNFVIFNPGQVTVC